MILALTKWMVMVMVVVREVGRGNIFESKKNRRHKTVIENKQKMNDMDRK